MPLYISPPPANPLTRFVMALVGLLVLVGSFMLGLVALAVVAGLGLVAGIALWIRVAWIRRKLRKEGFGDVPGAEPGNRSETDVLEAEYTVVRTRKDP
jgi:hypothetical protein